MRVATRTTDIALFALAIAIALGFGSYLAASRVTDPFLYFDVAFAKSLQGQAHMAIPESGPFASLAFVPGREMLMVQLAGMMGIAPETLQFLPVGTILVTAVLYVFARRLLRSPIAAFLLTVYLSLNLSHASALYSVFAYALALPLLFAFVLISIRMFERKDPRDVLLMVLIFVGIHSIHYTMATWLITYLLGANAYIWLRGRAHFRTSILDFGLKKRRPAGLVPADTAVGKRESSSDAESDPKSKIENPKLKAAPYLLIGVVVFFLAFNETVYKSFLPIIGGSTLDSAVQRFLSYLSFTSVADRSPYLYTRSSVPSLASTLALGFILVPVIVGLAYDAIKMLRARALPYLADKGMAVVWGIAVLGIIDAASYAIRGSVSTKSFSLLFPVLALIYARRTGKPVLLYGLAVLLVGSSIVKAGLFYANSYVISPDPTSSSYAAIRQSADWLQQHTTGKSYTMLADLNLYGKYLVDSVDRKMLPIGQGFTEDRYEQVIGAGSSLWSNPPDVVAVDKASTEPVISFVFLLFKPLQDYSERITANERVNLIYDDGSVLLGKPVVEQTSASPGNRVPTMSNQGVGRYGQR